jgi:hypothetical protein
MRLRRERKHVYSFRHWAGECWCQKNDKKVWDIGQSFMYGMFKGDMFLNRLAINKENTNGE